MMGVGDGGSGEMFQDKSTQQLWPCHQVWFPTN